MSSSLSLSHCLGITICGPCASCVSSHPVCSQSDGRQHPAALRSAFAGGGMAHSASQERHNQRRQHPFPHSFSVKACARATTRAHVRSVRSTRNVCRGRGRQARCGSEGRVGCFTCAALHCALCAPRVQTSVVRRRYLGRARCCTPEPLLCSHHLQDVVRDFKLPGPGAARREYVVECA